MLLCLCFQFSYFTSLLEMSFTCILNFQMKRTDRKQIAWDHAFEKMWQALVCLHRVCIINVLLNNAPFLWIFTIFSDTILPIQVNAHKSLSLSLWITIAMLVVASIASQFNHLKISAFQHILCFVGDSKKIKYTHYS